MVQKIRYDFNCEKFEIKATNEQQREEDVARRLFHDFEKKRRGGEREKIIV